MCLDDRWKKTVEDGISNRAWDAYDLTIQAEVEGYNSRFAGTQGYTLVDWKLIKAMLWSESGGPTNASWMTRPMQIGNKGDKGLAALKLGLKGFQGSEGTDIIMSAKLKKDLEAGNINTPTLNVRAGIAYIFSRMARSEVQSIVENPSAPPLTHVVAANENLDVIAGKVGSTLEVMRQLNGTKVLHVGDKVLYRKAKPGRVITGWREFTTQGIADRYNVTGDACYKQKLDHVLELFKRLKR